MAYSRWRPGTPYTRDHLPPIKLNDVTKHLAPDTEFNRRAKAFARNADKAERSLAASRKQSIKRRAKTESDDGEHRD